jgi:SAM-dependent methyltransferase
MATPKALERDVLPRLTALGRTTSDRALLGHALDELDLRHGLGSKIAAEPNLAAIMTEFVSRLMDAFGTLSAIRGLAVLDVACGSNSSRSPVTGERTAEFEPWMCRLLVELRARPVGIDIGDLAAETFTHYRVDLGIPGALDFLATGSFDAVHESRLFGSPEFRAAHGRATERIRREIHRQERRLLRPGGILIHRDGRPGPPGPQGAG